VGRGFALEFDDEFAAQKAFEGSLYRSFLAVLREKSLSAAARALNLTPLIASTTNNYATALNLVR
jgi:hypothetical protein